MKENVNQHIEEIEEAVKIIKASKYLVALTGAGIPVASGISLFRGLSGLWSKHGETPQNDYQRFLEDPVKMVGIKNKQNRLLPRFHRNTFNSQSQPLILRSSLT